MSEYEDLYEREVVGSGVVDVEPDYSWIDKPPVVWEKRDE